MKKILITIALIFSLMPSWCQHIPSVRLKNINGKTVNTGKLSNDGNPIVLSFFATWCKPCIRELTAIDAVLEEWQDRTGVRFIIVSIDDAQNAHKVKPLVDGQGWEYEVLLDPDGELKRLMQVQQIPHVFVLDDTGNVVYNHSGYTDGAEKELYQQILKVAGKD